MNGCIETNLYLIIEYGFKDSDANIISSIYNIILSLIENEDTIIFQKDKPTLNLNITPEHNPCKCFTEKLSCL